MQKTKLYRAFVFEFLPVPYNRHFNLFKSTCIHYYHIRERIQYRVIIMQFTVVFKLFFP